MLTKRLLGVVSLVAVFGCGFWCGRLSDAGAATAQAAGANVAGRVFELRTYTTHEGKLEALQTRFRDHTTKLFAKHGMTNFGYWLLDHDQKNAENTLIYLLAHKSQEAAAASFQAFRTDAEWLAAKEASEKAAGGSLTTKDGVQTVLMVPTDYSPTQ